MADDLEAFLRQAAARRAKRRKPPPQQAPAPTPPVAAEPPAREPPPVLQRPDPDTADDRFRQRMQEIQQETEELGHDVALSDDKLEARLHKTFGHRLGELARPAWSSRLTPAEQAAAPVTVGQITDMLKDPRSVAQAIVLAEILQRPEHRW